LFKQLHAAARAVPETKVTLYHRPPLRLEPDDLRRLCEIEALVGLKDGHRDVRLFRRLRSTLGRRLLWVTAWEDVAPAFWAMGADAFCPFSTAYAPEYSRAWLTALERGERDEVDALLAAHAHPMVDLRLSRPCIDVAVVKAAMTARGLRAGELRPPASSLTDSERRTVERLVANIAAVVDPSGRSTPLEARRMQPVFTSTTVKKPANDESERRYGWDKPD
jgi:5-dehydro-4-deoxyglucarate dehydratase